MEGLNNRLVSIITPAYNTAKYIHRLLDSVLIQSYPYIEMIVVDDGSTDNLNEVIQSYIPRFINRGYKLEYVSQLNLGQSEAIQKGLERINGYYLTWPDSDDWYSCEETIDRFVEALDSAPKEYAMVRCQGNLVDEDTGDVIKKFGENSNEYEHKSLFEDCLLDQNGFYFPPGAYMIKTHALKSSSRFPIYTSHDAGQNWQLMLPVLYHYRCCTIRKPMFNVLNRSNSHSRSQLEYQHFRKRRLTFETTIIETLNRIIGITELDLTRYTKKVNEKYAFMLWNTAIHMQQRKDEMVEYQRLKKLNKLTIKQQILHMLFQNRLMPLYSAYKHITRFLYASKD